MSSPPITFSQLTYFCHGNIILFMVDFFSSFSVLILLVVVLIVASFVYFVFKIVQNIIEKNIRKNNEETVLNIADAVNLYKESKSIDDLDELIKNVKIPKKMKISRINDEIIIIFKNLTYNVSIGRFIVENT